MFPVAPNPTRVRLYIAEKREAGVEIAVTEETVALPKGQQRTPEHLARNPMGQIPVLELDDGGFLLESVAIIQYLEELHPKAPMIGTDPLERARVFELERVADVGVLLPIGQLVHATNSPLGLPPNPAVAERARDALPVRLNFLNERLSDARPFLAGERPTIADCTLAAALQFARFGKVELDPDYEHVARWDREYRERAPARAVLVL